MMIRLVAISCLFLPLLAVGQVSFSQQQPVTVFSSEDKDWGIAPTTTLRRTQFHAPTPMSIPGGRVIKTLELKDLLEQNAGVVVVDVLNVKDRRSIPGAVWMIGAGDPQIFAAEKARLSAALERLAGGDKARAIVFLCFSSECWISYNAALHAIEAGFKDVIWYRGGTEAWKGANLPLNTPTAVSW